MKTQLLVLSVLSAMSVSALAAAPNACPKDAASCTIVSPNLGDKIQSADNSVSESTQNNPSSNSNQSGNWINPDNRDTNNNDGSITGGNTSSTGGTTSSTGNRLDNVHGGSASTGASTAQNGDQSFKAGVSSANKNGQGQGQGQSSANSQGQSFNAGKTNNDLNSSNANKVNSSNTMGKSGNSQTKVDASNNSNYSALAYRIPEINHVNPIALTNANSNTVVLQCGPYTGVRSEAVNGTYMGMFKKTMLEQGQNDTIVSAVNQNGRPVHFLTEIAADGSTLRIGSQNIITTSTISIGGSRSLNIGGGFGAGEYAQGGGGNSSQAQRVVQTVQSVPCVFDIIAAPAPRPVQELRYDDPVQDQAPEDLSYLKYGMKG